MSVNTNYSSNSNDVFAIYQNSGSITGVISLVDGQMIGNSKSNVSIYNQQGMMFLRNITVIGYNYAVIQDPNPRTNAYKLETNSINGYISNTIHIQQFHYFHLQIIISH